MLHAVAVAQAVIEILKNTTGMSTILSYSPCLIKSLEVDIMSWNLAFCLDCIVMLNIDPKVETLDPIVQPKP